MLTTLPPLDAIFDFTEVTEVEVVWYHVIYTALKRFELPFTRSVTHMQIIYSHKLK